MDIAKYVSRRLHPVRVTVSLLNAEMDRTKGKDVTIPRHLLESVVSTVEIFLEDCDRTMNRQQQSGGGGEQGGADNKKFVEAAKQTVKV